jgi:thymidylate kinase
MASIAVIGPDGAGKTTVARMLEDSGTLRLKYLYMGINTTSSNLALPTSRLVERMKRWRGAAGRHADHGAGVAAAGLPRPRRGILWRTARLTNRIAEHAFRQAVAWYYEARGFAVLYDRHFAFDFGGARDIEGSLPADRRIYHWFVSRVFPWPDLVILLDAPGAVLYARKGESTVDELEQRRQQLLAQGACLPAFVRIDATQSIELVYAQVERHVREFCTNG